MSPMRVALRDLVAAHLERDALEIEDRTELAALGSDSLDRVELTLQLEDTFGIEFDSAQELELRAVATFGELALLVERAAAEATRPRP